MGNNGKIGELSGQELGLLDYYLVKTSTCSLDFNQFPYELHGECLDTTTNFVAYQTMQSCCRSALLSIFQAMAVRANHSRSIFLDSAQAQDCVITFQSLHNKTDISKCELQHFISSTGKNLCSKDVDSVINSLGVEGYSSFQSNCNSLLNSTNYGDDACFDCLESYRQALNALKERDGTDGKGCAEALLVSLASSDIDSPTWVHGTFSCLEDEIEFSLPTKVQKKDGFILGSKKLFAAVIIAATLVILAPILYKLTRKRLQDSSDKEIENLSVIVLKKTFEDKSINMFNCSDLYLFSIEELAKATNNFHKSNLVGEGTLGKIYLGIMPSEMRVAIERMNEGINLYDLTDQIWRKAKIRHPNLVSILGYCDREDQCLVYEHCVNGDLENWLLGDRRIPILTWEQRLQISIGIARGLWFLHNNPLEKMLASILLNERLEAKLSGSISPKHKLNMTKGSKTLANDVFNFGVVLLQILTGRKSKSLVDEARDVTLKGGSVSEMADRRLRGAFVLAEFGNVFAVAVICTATNELERPNMEQILQRLEH
ncbi:probable serine/threonine-protein kinase PBL8 [Cornus florida]|uniref:probable serine/threonine-protein kinase PBL8 n=1 Tax=Cornus florida TaxID=4283 RepID=UPI00289AA880|nr:probable serine/threonine-protein kinase PBL8 [Cornus florida]